jgi:hypothetical protein
MNTLVLSPAFNLPHMFSIMAERRMAMAARVLIVIG